MIDEEVRALIEVYSDMTTQLTGINNSLQSIAEIDKAILDEFKDGFKKEIIESLLKAMESNQKFLLEQQKQQFKNFYWRLAGTIVLITGVFVLIVELITNLNQSGGIP